MPLIILKHVFLNKKGIISKYFQSQCGVEPSAGYSKASPATRAVNKVKNAVTRVYCTTFRNAA